MAIPKFACGIDNFSASKRLHIIILVVEGILSITALVITVLASLMDKSYGMDSKGKL